MEQNKNSESISSINPEDDLFTYIQNQDINSINEMLSKKEYPIWNYVCVENNNSSVLNISVFTKNYEITKILIDYCKTNNPEYLTQFINKENDLGIAPIHYASFKGDVKIIKLLIENGADFTKKTKKKLNVIHYCAQSNKPNVLMYFYLKLREDNKLENKYELIKEKDGGGSTPLHWAVYSLSEDLLLYLINLDIFESDEEKKNFMEQKDNQGNNALHLCIKSKTSRIAMKLLQYGANPSALNNKGETPLEVARNKQQDEIVEILENSLSCQLCNVKAPAKQIKRSYKKVICIFFFQILTTAIVFSSILPLALYSFDDIYKFIIFGVYFFLLIAFFLIYMILLIIDPGLKKRNNLKDLQELINNNKDLTKYCYKCFIKKTRDSKHCVICDNCYDNFDHHCYWINKCVAKRNYCLFITFLFESLLYLLSILIINILSIFNIFDCYKNGQNDYKEICENINIWFYSDICKKIFIKNLVWQLVNNFSLIIINLFFLIPECLLFFLHIKVCCTNYKNNKRIKDTESVSSDSFTTDTQSILLLPKKSEKL